MRNVVANRIRGPFADPVVETRFVKCFWTDEHGKALTAPTEFFPKGSSGIRVQGSSRNVVFPADTVFEDYYPDAGYPAEQATLKAFPNMGQFVQLTDEQSDFYVAEHAKATALVIGENRNATVFRSPQNIHFLRHNEPVSLSAAGKVIRSDSYVAMLTPDEVAAIVTDTKAIDAIKLAARFVHIEASMEKADTLTYRIGADGPVEEAMIGVLDQIEGDGALMVRDKSVH